MATVTFFEKPGCGNNNKQKAWLTSSGHTVLAKNLLTEKWDAVSLQGYFGKLPVAQWFNKSAPQIKSGELDPSGEDELTALGLLIASPILIRRPLMEVDGERRAGFDPELVREWIGLNDAAPQGDLQNCPKGQEGQPCPSSK